MPNKSVRRVRDQKSPMKSSGSETSRIVGVETSVYHAPEAITMSRWVAVSTWLHALPPRFTSPEERRPGPASSILSGLRDGQDIDRIVLES